MSLRFKSFVIIISFIIALSVFFTANYYYVLLNYSRDIEERFAEDSIERINTSLNIEIEDFAFKCSSFSDWVKTFINSPNKKYINNNLKEFDYENCGFSFVAIADLKGDIIYADSYDYPLKAGLKSTIRDIFNNNVIKEAAKNLEAVSGIINIGDEVCIISFNTIMGNKDSAGPSGYFIAGRNIENANIFKVKYGSDHLSFSLFADDARSSYFNEIRAEVLLDDLAIRQDDELRGLHSYHLVRDISGKPSILLTLYQQSNIFDISRKATIFIIYTSIAVIIVLISVFILIFEKLIVSKVTKLNEDINMFMSGSRYEQDQPGRKNINKTDDEIDKLGENVQKVLGIINYRYSAEKLFTGMINEFLKMDYKNENIISFINTSLGKIGGFTGADRAFIMIKDDRMETISIKYEWDAYGIEPLIDKFSKYPTDNIKPISDILQETDVFFTKPFDFDESADNQDGEMKLFADLNVKSCIVAGLDKTLVNPTGFLFISTAIEEKLWYNEEVDLLKNSAVLFSRAISLIDKY
jgi:sensor domain CHASE-containing protein